MSAGLFLRRKWIKLREKIVGEKASPEYIARGWAVGMFYGTFAPIGTQLVLSIPTALLLKGSKVGAVLGTFLTNHFTVWFIYPAQCWLGARILHRDISYPLIKSALRDLIRERSFSAMMDVSEDLLASFFLGGFVMAVLLTPPTYFLVRRLVVRFRAEVEERKHRRRERILQNTGARKRV